MPFLPDVFDLERTGMKEFPYWYRATMGTDRKWVLLHHTQCIPIVPGKSEQYALGTSSTWMCVKMIAEEVLEDDRRIELMVNALADGLLGIGPVYMTAEKIRDDLQKTGDEAQRKGNILAKGYTIFTSPTGAIQFSDYSLRKESGIEFQERLQANQDAVALAFQEPLSKITTRGGVGFGSQADTVADENSGGGVDAILNLITVALGTMFPRVQVAVKRQNDRAQRLNIATFKTLSEGVKNINATGTVLSPAVVRAIIDRDIFDLPSVDENIIHTTSTNDEDASQENTVDEDGSEEGQEQEPAQDEGIEAMIAMIRIAHSLSFFVPEGAEDELPELSVNPDAVATEEFDDYWDDEDYPGLLQSEVFETEADVDEENQNRWVWIAGAWVYLVATQNRRVDRNESVTIRDTMVEQRQPSMSDVMESMIAGQISVQNGVACRMEYLAGRRYQCVPPRTGWRECHVHR